MFGYFTEVLHPNLHRSVLGEDHEGAPGWHPCGERLYLGVGRYLLHLGPRLEAAAVLLSHVLGLGERVPRVGGHARLLGTPLIAPGWSTRDTTE